MGEDYASQTRSQFDWYNPHPYNYLQPLLFYKTVGLLSISFERRSAGKFFTSILRSNANLFIHAFMRLCLVRLWLLCGGKKNGRVKYFL